MNIGIIGSGGAGMTAAWLLDGRHQVTLFERGAALGGHARTTVVERDGRTHYADEGFGWFSDLLYPRLMRLMELTAVPLRTVPLSMAFTQHHLGRTLVLPPAGPAGLLRMFRSPAALRDLVRLDRALRAGARVVRRRDRLVSWGEFIGRNRFAERFCQDMLTPIVVGGWGAPHARAHEVSAYTMLKYIVLHRPGLFSRYPWRVVRDGAASYIRGVARTLRTVNVRMETAVASLVPRERGWTVYDQHGVRHDFDRIVLATGARDAAAILKETPGLERTREVLSGFEYHTVRIATHSDPAFMPPDRTDWQVANIGTDGSWSWLTVWTGHEGGSDVFTSFILDREPRECHNVSTFHVPLITPDHYRAQGRLAGIQGEGGLYFAGDWTGDIGCHEDAVVSAIDACRHVDPQAPRLAEIEAPCQLPAARAA